jgi:hypothetical protein
MSTTEYKGIPRILNEVYLQGTVNPFVGKAHWKSPGKCKPFAYDMPVMQVKIGARFYIQYGISPYEAEIVRLKLKDRKVVALVKLVEIGMHEIVRQQFQIGTERSI